ncbi:hypothetical protein GALMADRAFT_245344 [Galerina marginata CBS 339.88]|uniref:Palmitoyltransferase n=1 Tax=Galerina marginata (strain CBS 339.88) TaxID=685588 RepID=A0A067T7B4_GALM3|nr:hypothetical protein GALMADRAFT_245344 [Galerina marginata CBS 339.88]
MAPSTGSPNFHKSKDKTCCGVIEEAAEAARDRRYNRTKPQPWIVRKLMIGVTLGIMGYAAYVYIQQLCLPMIRRRNGALASQGTGIALLVVFCVLYLWMVWAYVKVVLTAPGYARDHIRKSERPLIPVSAPLRDSWQSTARSHDPTDMPPPVQDVEMGHSTSSHRPRQNSLSVTTSRTHTYSPSQRRENGNGLAGPSYEDLLRREGAEQAVEQVPNVGTLDSIQVPKPALLNGSETQTSSIPPPETLPAPTSSVTITSQHERKNRRTDGPTFLDSKLKLKKPNPLAPIHTRSPSSKGEKELERERQLQLLNVTRRPSTTPVLHPVHRYCTTDEIVKPYRAHHCRVCGTCVLKYDHHCPWIGQCVGARNHKFFLNFCQATMVLTSYMLGTLVAYTVVGSNSPSPGTDINPQEIVVIALAALFLLFTSLLAISHTNMILRGQTTVESMQIRSFQEREERTLAKAFSWWEFGAKKQKTREWDQEWGRPSKEGYIWWKGSAYIEWVDVMGRNWLGWILPIGRSGSDGVVYPVNPRFDSEGRWQRRSEWPEELR